MAPGGHQDMNFKVLVCELHVMVLAGNPKTPETGDHMFESSKQTRVWSFWSDGAHDLGHTAVLS